MSDFWKNLCERDDPIIGLAPMDGVTDAAFRYMVCKYGKPSLTMTEFTNVEGLARGSACMLKAFLYDEIERPVIGQIYGVEVDSYYKCSLMLCALGFDGIDINMGCPANKVAKRGSGAALIQTPDLAKEIVRSCKKAARDWSEGITLEQGGVHEDVIAKIREMNEGRSFDRLEVPVSVKTRIGFKEVVGVEWTKHLLETEPANITMHGRTLKQMYMGLADWDEIARCAEVCRESGVSLLGNGDVKSMEDARARVRDYGVDGVLVGRATFGNPWFFSGYEATPAERKAAALEHCEVYQRLNLGPFNVMKKHLAWYMKGFDGARELRHGLMSAKGMEEIFELLGGPNLVRVDDSDLNEETLTMAASAKDLKKEELTDI